MPLGVEPICGADCRLAWLISGFRVKGLGFRVQGSGFRVRGKGHRV